MAKRIDYLIALINEFGRKYGLTDKESYLYLHTNIFIHNHLNVPLKNSQIIAKDREGTSAQN